MTTAPVVLDLARRHDVDMPITETVTSLLDGRIAARDAITTLMSRRPTTDLCGLLGGSRDHARRL